MRKSVLWFTGLVIIAAASRLIPHLDNLTALTAVSVLAGYRAKQQKALLLVPFFAMFLSDLVLNNIIYAAYTDGFVALSSSALFLYTPYLLLAGIAMIGLRKMNFMGYLGTGVLGAVLFFIISNLGVWLTSAYYPANASGLMMAYEAAIPFLRNELMGTLLYGTALYAAFSAVRRSVPEML